MRLSHLLFSDAENECCLVFGIRLPVHRRSAFGHDLQSQLVALDPGLQLARLVRGEIFRALGVSVAVPDQHLQGLRKCGDVCGESRQLP